MIQSQNAQKKLQLYNLRLLNPIKYITPQEMYDEFIPEENWFLEYLKNPDSFYKNRDKKIKNTPSRLEAVWRGGMPGILELPDSALPVYFSSYIQTYVERDVRILENIEDLAAFGTFLSLLSALTSQEINYSQLGREIGISPKTAQRWLQLLTFTPGVVIYAGDICYRVTEDIIAVPWNMQ